MVDFGGNDVESLVAVLDEGFHPGVELVEVWERREKRESGYEIRKQREEGRKEEGRTPSDV